MPNDCTKRCRHCGGTLWQDGDVVKCFMCSRPVNGQNGPDKLPISFGRPKLPGGQTKSYVRQAK